MDHSQFSKRRRANLAKADRVRSSIPWSITLAAYRRIEQRASITNQEDMNEVKRALQEARRLPEDGKSSTSANGFVQTGERWLFEFRGKKFVAVCGIDERNAERCVLTIHWYRPLPRVAPGTRHDL